MCEFVCARVRVIDTIVFAETDVSQSRDGETVRIRGNFRFPNWRVMIYCRTKLLFPAHGQYILIRVRRKISIVQENVRFTHFYHVNTHIGICCMSHTYIFYLLSLAIMLLGSCLESHVLTLDVYMHNK